MTLKNWFEKYHLRPILIISIIFLLTWVAVLSRSLINLSNQQRSNVEQIASLLSATNNQKNLILSENLLDVLVNQGGALDAQICDNKNQVLGVNVNFNSCKNKNSIFEITYKTKIPSTNNLILHARYSLFKSYESLIFSFGISLLMTFIIFMIALKLHRKIKSDILDPILKKLIGSEELKIDELNDLRLKIQEIYSLETKIKISEALKENNEQVAHDIRSPLSTLNLVVDTLTNIDIEKKELLLLVSKRINDIADKLITKKEHKKFNFNLYSVIYEIILEKKSINPNILFEINSTEHQNHYLVTGDITEFKRLLSNLINNSIESIKTIDGVIKIDLKKIPRLIILQISDNGCGISQEHLKIIGKRNFSHGKINGTGLGIYHAMNYVKSLNGQIYFKSEINIGTRVSIELPYIT